MANLLITCSLYMLIPVLPLWCTGHNVYANGYVALITALAGCVCWVLGPLCSYLLDHFKRRTISLLFAGLAVSLTVFFFDDFRLTILGLLVIRTIQGVSFGMLQMSLGSGLVIDLTSSARRNDGNFSYNSFGRLAMSLGPLAGLVLYQYLGMEIVLYASVCMGLFGCLLVWMLRVPFRAPLDPPILSRDRFWLKGGVWHFLVLLLNCFAMGVLLVLHPSAEFYGLLMVGLMLALFAARVIFENADPRAEAVSGMILLAAAFLLLLSHPWSEVLIVVSVLSGLGIGLSTSRILLCLLRKADHCERGCANTTYLIAWESGLALGIGYALLLGGDLSLTCYITGLMAVLLSLVIYVFYHKKNIAL